MNRAESAIASASIVVCQLEVSIETSLQALRLAKKHGVISLFNPAPAKADLDVELLKLASIICPNETELGLLTGLPIGTMEEIKQAAKALVKKGERDT